MHSALKNQIINDEDNFKSLVSRVTDLENGLKGDISKLNNSVFPEVDSVMKRRKVDLDDLKGWLTETIDTWVSQKSEEIDWKYEEKYKSIILKQKNEIQDLKS